MSASPRPSQKGATSSPASPRSLAQRPFPLPPTTFENASSAPHVEMDPTQATNPARSPTLAVSTSEGGPSRRPKFDTAGTSSSNLSSHWPESRKPFSRHATSATDAESRAGAGKETRSTSSRWPLSIASKGVHRKDVGKLPMFCRPSADAGGPWLAEEDVGTEWLNLFYDLAVVAVLTVFSSTHEIQKPSAIPIFFSYYVIISWLWTAQVHYDIRFQAEDIWHRLCRCWQIMLFIYIGAASGGWNPGLLQDPNTLDQQIGGTERAAFDAARASWLTVLIAFCIARAVLFVQYVMCMFWGRRHKRNTRVLIPSLLTLVASMILVIIAVALPARSPGAVIAKICLFYLAIGVETWGVWAQLHRNLTSWVRTEQIGERYGALSLIILGEGFISLTRAFNSAISGLGNSASATYAQVFIAIGIIYFLWLFLFNRFRATDNLGQRRAIIWETIHFPLHYCLLLLLASIVNVIIVLSFAHGTQVISDAFYTLLGTIEHGQIISAEAADSVGSYLDMYMLFPSFDEQVQQINDLVASSQPAQDAVILTDQYWGQVILQTTQNYGIEVDSEMVASLANLYNVPTDLTYPLNNTLVQERRDDASRYLIEVIEVPVNDALSGTLWLYPCAGGFLILATIRSLLWYRFNGPVHWLIHGPQLVGGLALALLGLLDLGSKTYDVTQGYAYAHVNRTYRLLESSWILAVVLIVYGAVFLVPWWIIRLWHQWKGEDLAKTGSQSPEEERGDERTAPNDARGEKADKHLVASPV